MIRRDVMGKNNLITSTPITNGKGTTCPNATVIADFLNSVVIFIGSSHMPII